MSWIEKFTSKRKSSINYCSSSNYSCKIRKQPTTKKEVDFVVFEEISVATLYNADELPVKHFEKVKACVVGWRPIK